MLLGEKLRWEVVEVREHCLGTVLAGPGSYKSDAAGVQAGQADIRAPNRLKT